MAREKDLLRVQPEVLPLEHCAMLRELLTAYRLLEDHGQLKVLRGRVQRQAGQRTQRWRCLPYQPPAAPQNCRPTPTLTPTHSPVTP